jgi:hypothetical protein
VSTVATRRERVVLELEDRFTPGMVKAAAAAALFDKQIDKSGKRTDAFGRELTGAERETTRLSGTLSRSTRELDSYSGRLGLLASTLGAIGPAAVPIAAVAIPAVTGLAQQFGFAALAGGTAVLAFQGVGDALTAMNKAHLEPTAANLEKARQAMEQLSPAAQDLVKKLASMRGELGKLKDAAGSGILPGATAALDDLEKRLPIVERILHQVSMAVGDALRDGAASLAGPEWDKFFKFIAVEARPELTKLAKSVGNVAHGLAEMWVAFGPLNSDFSSWMLKASRDFNSWATGLSKTEGFQEFVAYIRENGPKVGEALAAISNALLQIVEAAAPMGGPILDALTAVANVIADIADSDLGTPIFGMVAAFSALSLATKAWEAISKGALGTFISGQAKAGAAIKANTSALASQGSAIRTLAGGATRVGFAAAAFSGLADNVGLSTAAMGGFVAGPWGAGAGLLYDVATSGNDAADALDRLGDAVHAGNFSAINAQLASTTAEIEKQKNSVGGYLKLAIQGIDIHSRSGWNFDSTGLGHQIEQRNALEQASGDLQLGIQTVGQFNGIGSSGAATGLEDLNRVITKVKPAMDDLGISMDDLAQGARDGSIIQMGKDIDTWLKDPLNRAKLSADQFKVSIESVYAVLSKRASMRDFEAAIDAASQSLKDNGKTLDIHTEKGRNNQAALDNIANTALKVAESLTGMNRVRMLEQARDDFARTAHSMGMTWDKANALADKLIQIDKLKVEPEIKVDPSRALAEIARVRAYLDSLHGKSIAVNVTRRLVEQTGLQHADGGLISGPGGPRDDRIPALLSNGEFVVNAAATARNRGLLESINAQRFADGGLATYASYRDRSHGAHSGSNSTNRLAVQLGDLRVVGTLDTPWGPAQVEGIARSAARSEITDASALSGTHARMYANGGERG